MRRIRLYIADILRKIQLWIAPNYWRCTWCGHVDWVEKEVMCWKCNKGLASGLGEMIYKGD